MASLTRDGVAAIHVLRLGSRKDTVSLDSLNLHEAHADFREIPAAEHSNSKVFGR